jgi:hypothetical protein
LTGSENLSRDTTGTPPDGPVAVGNGLGDRPWMAPTDTLPNSWSPLWHGPGGKCQYEWWRTGVRRPCLWPEISPSVNLPHSNSNSNTHTHTHTHTHTTLVDNCAVRFRFPLPGAYQTIIWPCVCDIVYVCKHWLTSLMSDREPWKYECWATASIMVLQCSDSGKRTPLCKTIPQWQ